MELPDESIEDFDKVIQIDPDFGIAYLNRGISKALSEDMGGACNDWNKAIEWGLSCQNNWQVLIAIELKMSPSRSTEGQTSSLKIPQLGVLNSVMGNDTGAKNPVLTMVDLPLIELKQERQEVIGFMIRPFRQDPDFRRTKESVTSFVNRMGTRNVLDCLAVIKA